MARSAVVTPSPTRRSGELGWSGLAAAVGTTRHWRRHHTSEQSNLRLVSGSSFWPGSMTGRATHRQRSQPSSDGSRSSRRRRERWSVSPSWPTEPANRAAWSSCDAAKPRSSVRWRRTASASGATSRFSSSAERTTLARLAESAGRRHEARALYSWALKADRENSAAQEGLARLDRADAERRTALSANAVALPEPSPGTQDQDGR